MGPLVALLSWAYKESNWRVSAASAFMLGGGAFLALKCYVLGCSVLLPWIGSEVSYGLWWESIKGKSVWNPLIAVNKLTVKERNSIGWQWSGTGNKALAAAHVQGQQWGVICPWQWMTVGGYRQCTVSTPREETLPLVLEGSAFGSWCREEVAGNCQGLSGGYNWMRSLHRGELPVHQEEMSDKQNRPLLGDIEDSVMVWGLWCPC
jgi:hypothetical protein